MLMFQHSREIEEFAVSLARDFTARVPPGSGTGDAARIARAIDDVCNRAREFQRQKRLGIYGRAKLGTSFKFELKNSGYEDDFIDTLTHQVLLVMSG
jgi:hypothetical protein